MATKKKMLQAAAGNAGGAGLDITDVFSTYLYTGNGSAQTITNGIDLDGEGGLVWAKMRSDTVYASHALYDTERGAYNLLYSDSTSASVSVSPNGLSAFNSNGFSLSGSAYVDNANGEDYASWTFRKAPKFFDVVTYTGDTDGSSGQTISHSLGSTPGMIIVKRTDTLQGWYVSHRYDPSQVLQLNRTDAAVQDTDYQNLLGATDTTFTADYGSNTNGATYVAYLFAHNDGDGEFGPNGDQDIIKCGSYTGDGSGLATVDLGFEPQWVMIKRAGTTSNWEIIDTMRGFPTNPIGAGTADNARLFANLSNAESGFPMLGLTSTGFVTGASWGAGEEVIYIAIRRGPLAPPESGTEVFAMDTAHSDGDNTVTGDMFTAGFPVDMGIYKQRSSSSFPFVNSARLVGERALYTNSTEQEGPYSDATWDHQSGWFSGSTAISTDRFSWMWRRAPNFFDVVAYTGDGTTNRLVQHNLGVKPELVVVKNRGAVENWIVTSPLLGDNPAGKLANLYLDDTMASAGGEFFNTSGLTSETIGLRNWSPVNASGNTYIAYLFASLDGVSKVFSVTKSSGSDASVNCGFSSGPRFVMLKRTDSTGDWYIWDTERGIVAGNDPYLLLNSTAAEVTSTDYIDPTSNGFTIVNGGLADGDYIGYAVA